MDGTLWRPLRRSRAVSQGVRGRRGGTEAARGRRIGIGSWPPRKIEARRNRTLRLYIYVLSAIVLIALTATGLDVKFSSDATIAQARAIAKRWSSDHPPRQRERRRISKRPRRNGGVPTTNAERADDERQRAEDERRRADAEQRRATDAVNRSIVLFINSLAEKTSAIHRHALEEPDSIPSAGTLFARVTRNAFAGHDASAALPGEIIERLAPD